MKIEKGDVVDRINNSALRFVIDRNDGNLLICIPGIKNELVRPIHIYKLYTDIFR